MKHQLAELETQLAQMGRAKRVAVHLIVLCATVYMSWVLYGEALSEEIVSKQEQIESLEMKLLKNSNRSLESAILKAKKESLVLEDGINHLHFQKQFLQTKLQSINFIYYNERGSIEILDDILKFSVEGGIALEQIKSTLLESKPQVHLQPKSRLVVSGTGDFAAITGLHHYIDSLNALLVTESLHVSIDEMNATRFELILLHYGVDL